MAKEKNVINRLGRMELMNTVKTALIVLLGIIVLVLAVLDAYLASLPKSQPYVIELTGDGEARYNASQVQLLQNWTPNDATQRYFIMQYVMNLRSVSTDNSVNQANALSVYARSLSSASSLIGEWYSVNNPIERAATQYVKIPAAEMSVVLYADKVWQVTWRETIYRRSDNAIVSDKQYEGRFSVEFYTPATERDLRNNPIGMYISGFSIKEADNLT